MRTNRKEKKTIETKERRSFSTCQNQIFASSVYRKSLSLNYCQSGRPFPLILERVINPFTSGASLTRYPPTTGISSITSSSRPILEPYLVRVSIDGIRGTTTTGPTTAVAPRVFNFPTDGTCYVDKQQSSSFSICTHIVLFEERWMKRQPPHSLNLLMQENHGEPNTYLHDWVMLACINPLGLAVTIALCSTA